MAIKRISGIISICYAGLAQILAPHKASFAGTPSASGSKSKINNGSLLVIHAGLAQLFRVSLSSGEAQGNQHLKTCFQSSCCGVAECDLSLPGQGRNLKMTML